MRGHLWLVCVVLAAWLVSGAAVPATAQTVVRPDTRAPSRVLAGLGAAVRDVRSSDVASDKHPDAASEGALVTAVTSGGPAAKAGVLLGDVFVEFDGEHVRSAAGQTRQVGETPAGRAVRAVLLRDGKRVEVTITREAGAEGRTFTFELPQTPDWQGQMEVRPPILRWPYNDNRGGQVPPFPQTPPFSSPLPFDREPPKLGVTVLDMTPQLQRYFGAPHGVLVSGVTAGTGAARAGLRAGDVITSIDDHQVDSRDDLQRSVAEKRPGDVVTVALVRDRKPMALKVTLSGTFQVRPIEAR